MNITEEWSIPEMRMYPELHDNIKKLYGRFGQDEVDPETVARLWDHKSAKSSQFSFVKLGSLRSYGLVEGRGKIKVSDLGRRLTFPSDEKEGNDAIVQAIRNIPLWKVLFDTFTVNGKEIPTDTFWMDLRRIVGEDKLPPEEAQKKAGIVRKAYLDDIKYYRAEKKTSDEESRKMPDQFNKSIATSPSIERQASIVQNLMIEGAFDIAKQYIDFVKQKKESEAPTKE